MKVLFFRSLLMVLVFTSAKSIAQESNDLLKKRVDNYLNENISNGLSGAVLIVRNGEILLSKGYGFANREDNIKNTPKTVFDIGSNTKQFTAAAILKLVEQEKISLTDNLETFFKNVPEDKKKITIHQLLSHSAGIKTYSGSDFDVISLDDFLKYVFTSELLFSPGTKYNYSNVGYSVLAIIIEQVSGQEYEDFISQYLFKPAGMQQTGYLLPKWKDKLVAQGHKYTIENIGTMIDRYKEQNGPTWHLKGNGGIHSTSEDLYKWYLALKNNIVLPEHLKEKLFTPHISQGREGNSSYGYGWVVTETSRQTKVVLHNGANPFFFSEMIWFTEDDVFIVYSTNSRSDESEGVARVVQRMVFDQNYQPEPMVKSQYSYILEFVESNNLNNISKLTTSFKGKYGFELGDKSVLNRVGYFLIHQDEKNEWAIPLLKLNIDLFPGDGNLWDTLGEAYIATDQKLRAIDSFEKALELQPESNCYWCDNATDKLKKLKTTE
ncbi:serine hydrolase [Flavobacteriaceae bacterium R38]|nr:serine hydrolase [Flavobacteriaceae bacterium R38]